MVTAHKPPPPTLPDSESAQRSLYMRLYRSWWQDEELYPLPPSDAADAAAMQDAGHCEIVAYRGGTGLRLTWDGLTAWAQMNAEYMRRWKRGAYDNLMYDPLRCAAGMMHWDDVNEKAKEKMMNLSSAQVEILKTLAASDTPVRLKAGQGGKALRALADAGLTVKGDAGWEITDAGTEALRTAPQIVTESEIEAMRQALAAAPVGVPWPMPVMQQTNECADCVHRKVLELLMESLPAARELFDIVKRQQEVLAKLKGE